MCIRETVIRPEIVKPRRPKSLNQGFDSRQASHEYDRIEKHERDIVRNIEITWRDSSGQSLCSACLRPGVTFHASKGATCESPRSKRSDTHSLLVPSAAALDPALLTLCSAPMETPVGFPIPLLVPISTKSPSLSLASSS